MNGVASQWTYGVQQGKNTVTDPLGNVAVHNWGYLHALNNTVLSSSMYEMSATYSDSSAHLLRTVSNQYASEYDPINKSVANARVISQTTTLENGQVMQKQTDFATFTYACNVGGGYCPATATRFDPTSEREYDYGTSAPGPLLGTTSTAYKSFLIGGTTITKPQTVTIYDGSGHQAAQTVYEYDIYSHANQPMQASGAVQHSASYGTSYTNRGNVTAAAATAEIIGT